MCLGGVNEMLQIRGISKDFRTPRNGRGMALKR
jgi:hypothetical protein